MSYKRINITVPEEDLDRINKYCNEVNISKSYLVREAAITYIAAMQRQKEVEKKNKEISEAIEAIYDIKGKIKFNNSKTSEEMVREIRDGR
ncbi:MAG: CopG family transcriptional regulator [Actinobacteria bacterium]|nr:CopG family transcriptional regulator [Actinomycetota bacterium]